MCAGPIAIPDVTEMILILIEETFDLELACNFHDARYLRFGDIRLTRIHVFEQCLHLKTFHFRTNDSAVFRLILLQYRFEIW